MHFFDQLILCNHYHDVRQPIVPRQVPSHVGHRFLRLRSEALGDSASVNSARSEASSYRAARWAPCAHRSPRTCSPSACSVKVCGLVWRAARLPPPAVQAAHVPPTTRRGTKSQAAPTTTPSPSGTPIGGSRSTPQPPQGSNPTAVRFDSACGRRQARPATHQARCKPAARRSAAPGGMR